MNKKTKTLLKLVFVLVIILIVNSIAKSQIVSYSDTIEVLYTQDSDITNDTVYVGIAHYVYIDEVDEYVYSFFDTKQELLDWEMRTQTKGVLCRKLMVIFKE